MPTIKTYTQQTDTPGAVQGARAQGFGNALGELGSTVQGFGEVIQKRAEQSEISDINAKLAEAHSKFTNDWAETLRTADPNDKELSQKFVQKFDNYMTELQGSYSTRQGKDYFNQSYARLKSHFVENSFAGQADLAGIAAVQNYQTFQNNLSAGLTKNPDQFDLVRQMHDDGLNRLVQTGGLSTAAAMKLKTAGNAQMAEDAIRGWTNLDYNYAKQKLDSGEYDSYLGGDAKRKLYGEIHLAENAARVEEERRRQEAKRILEEQQKITQQDFLERMQQGKLNVKTILNSNLEQFGSGSKKQFIDMLDEHNKAGGVFRTDPGTFTDLFRRIHLPDGDKDKIVDDTLLNDYVLKRQLSFDDLQKLRKEIQGKNSEEGGALSESKKQVMNIARSRLVNANPMLGIKDPKGELQLKLFMDYMFSKEAEFRKQNKSPASLYESNSQDYVVNELNRFARSPNEMISDMVSPNGPKSTAPIGVGNANITLDPTTNRVVEVAPVKKPPVPRLPNETPAQYLERMKGTK